MFKFTLANLSKCTWIPACWRKSCCAWGQWAGIWFRVSWTPLSNCHTFRRCQIEESLILTGSTPVSNHPCSLQGLCSNMSQALHHFELNMWHIVAWLIHGPLQNLHFHTSCCMSPMASSMASSCHPTTRWSFFSSRRIMSWTFRQIWYAKMQNFGDLPGSKAHIWGPKSTKKLMVSHMLAIKYTTDFPDFHKPYLR